MVTESRQAGRQREAPGMPWLPREEREREHHLGLADSWLDPREGEPEEAGERTARD